MRRTRGDEGPPTPQTGASEQLWAASVPLTKWVPAEIPLSSRCPSGAPFGQVTSPAAARGLAHDVPREVKYSVLLDHVPVVALCRPSFARPALLDQLCSTSFRGSHQHPHNPGNRPTPAFCLVSLVCEMHTLNNATTDIRSPCLAKASSPTPPLLAAAFQHACFERRPTLIDATGRAKQSMATRLEYACRPDHADRQQSLVHRRRHITSVKGSAATN